MPETDHGHIRKSDSPGEYFSIIRQRPPPPRGEKKKRQAEFRYFLLVYMYMVQTTTGSSGITVQNSDKN